MAAMDMIIGFKLIGAFTLFAVTFLFTLLPNKLKHMQELQLKNITSFCGGLFLGLCFLHLIPDTLSEFQKLERLQNLQKKYPMAELIVIIGMIFVMSAEKFASIIQMNKKDKPKSKCDGSKDCCKEKCPVQDEERTPFARTIQNTSYVTEKEDSVLLLDESDEPDTIVEEKPNGLVNEDEAEKESITQVLSASAKHRKNVKLLKIRTFCLVIALMLHSLFEGLTVGLQTTKIGIVVLVSLITFHKCIIGFSLGMALINAKSDFKTFLKKAGAFAVSSPIGVFIGIIICSTNLGLLNDEAIAVLTAISTGAFFYITFFEILSKCLVGNKIRDLVSYACFLFGFTIFACITIVPKMQL